MQGIPSRPCGVAREGVGAMHPHGRKPHSRAGALLRLKAFPWDDPPPPNPFPVEVILDDNRHIDGCLFEDLVSPGINHVIIHGPGGHGGMDFRSEVLLSHTPAPEPRGALNPGRG